MRFATVIASFTAAVFLLATPATARPAPENFADLAERLSPAVVNISTTQKVKPNKMVMEQFRDLPPGSPFEEFREFFDQFENGAPGGKPGSTAQKAYSLGSGFVIDPSGIIVTNSHVIEEAEEISVIFSDNTKLKAEVIGRDKKTDIALLRVKPAKPLVAVSFGDSDKARVGDWVIAIGNPFGLGGSVSAGIISARARNINAGPFDDFIQTDAAINRGNSGGPLFDVDGKVIGINTAIFSPSGGNIGIGFATPAALAVPVIEQLKTYGKTKRGWLGVKIQEVNDEIAESLPGFGAPRGAMVAGVTKGSPADTAGIVSGDVLLSFDGKDITEMRKLPRAVAETEIGKTVDVVLWRKGEQKTVKVTLGEMNEKDEAADTAKHEEDAPKPHSGTREVSGMKLATLTPPLRAELGLGEKVRGVAVLDVAADKDAYERGVRAGDVITHANEEPVTDPEAVVKQIEAARKAGRKSILLRIDRGGDMQFIAVPTK